MDSLATETKEYFGALDTLRFLAFFCVFISHMIYFSGITINYNWFNTVSPYLFTQGNLGVNFFFVLSGFLITWLLLREKSKTGEIRIGKFYMRRILRIWPIYFLVVAVGFFIVPNLLQHVYGSTLSSSGFGQFMPADSVWWVIFLATNFYMVIEKSLPYFIAVLWSVSIEEQFYLVWPWIVKFVLSRHMIFVYIGLVLFSALYRFVYIHDMEQLRYSTFANVSDLILGACTAHIVSRNVAIRGWFQKRGKVFGYLLLAAVPVFFVVYKTVELRVAQQYSLVTGVGYTLMPIILSVYFVTLILFACFSQISYLTPGLRNLLEYLGRRSYGLYCYHALAILSVNVFVSTGLFHIPPQGVLAFALHFVCSFGLTVLFAVVSFRYIEEPILRYKRNFEVR